MIHTLERLFDNMGKRRNRNKKAQGGIVNTHPGNNTTGAANYAPTQGAGTAGTSGYIYSARKECHKGPVAIFTVGKATVFAGSRFEVPWRRWGLLISCAGPELTPIPLITCSPRAKAMIPELPEATPWIALGWPDGTAPRHPRSTWLVIAEAIKNLDGDIGVCCLGGHGRTGTAIAILATLCGAVPEGEDPVEWVRKRYCHEAVESKAQAAYVEHITGRPVGAEGSQEWWLDDSRYATSIVTTITKPAVSHNTAAGVPSTPSQAKLPLPPVQEAMGRAGKPVVNAAGDIIGYTYTAEPDDPEEGEAPWQKWGGA